MAEAPPEAADAGLSGADGEHARRNAAALLAVATEPELKQVILPAPKAAPSRQAGAAVLLKMQAKPAAESKQPKAQARPQAAASNDADAAEQLLARLAPELPALAQGTCRMALRVHRFLERHLHRAAWRDRLGMQARRALGEADALRALLLAQLQQEARIVEERWSADANASERLLGLGMIGTASTRPPPQLPGEAPVPAGEAAQGLRQGRLLSAGVRISRWQNALQGPQRAVWDASERAGEGAPGRYRGAGADAAGQSQRLHQVLSNFARTVAQATLGPLS